MISDEIEVTTCHPDEQSARVLSLRSLHGKYLIRLLDGDSPELPPHIKPHGTRIKLKVRSSADLKDLPGIVRRWIMFPRCRVSVSVDGAPPTTVGFMEPREAVKQELKEMGWPTNIAPDNPEDGDVKIAQRSRNGVTLAYTVVCFFS